MNLPIRLVLADSQTVVREGVRAMLASETDIRIVGEAANLIDVLGLVARLQPHLLVIDPWSVVGNGVDGIHQLRQRWPTCQVLVLTNCDQDAVVRSAIRAGAVGYWLKDLLKGDLIRAIYAAAQGEATLHPVAQRVLIRQSLTPGLLRPSLTAREYDVIALITQGKSNKEIAATLHLTEGTVKGYLSKIFDKLQVADRTQAALYAVKHRLELEK
jgi:DNA-binding NarL/FixJ family response regulator